MTVDIAIVGYGEIARNEHVPAIRANRNFRLAAVVTRGTDPSLDVPCFADVQAMLAALPGRVDAVALCTPPVVRYAIASEALAAGLGVLLEKPPTTTLGEIVELERLARQVRAPLYTAWHSQHSAGVAKAADALRGQEIAELQVAWREDVRKWHPGQQWIWEAGGFGVFDPGINALSILSRILPIPLLVQEAQLLIPRGRQSPIAADIIFSGGNRRASFDWRVTGDEDWSILVTTRTGMTLQLQAGGSTLIVDGETQDLPEQSEYTSIYSHFLTVMREHRVEADLEPLRITADAFLRSTRRIVEPFGE